MRLANRFCRLSSILSALVILGCAGVQIPKGDRFLLKIESTEVTSAPQRFLQRFNFGPITGPISKPIEMKPETQMKVPNPGYVFVIVDFTLYVGVDELTVAGKNHITLVDSAQEFLLGHPYRLNEWDFRLSESTTIALHKGKHQGRILFVVRSDRVDRCTIRFFDKYYELRQTK